MTSAPLRLLMVAPSSIAGGAEDIFFRLIDGIRSHEAQPTVALFHEGPLADRLRSADLHPVILGAGRLRDVGRTARVARDLSRLIVDRRPHVAVSSLPKGHVYLALPAWRHHCPAMFFQMNVPADPPFWLDRVAARLPSRRVLALSEDAARAQQRITRKPVEVLHPGTDPDAFSPEIAPGPRAELGIGDDELLVGIVGRLEPWKGQEVFLRAAAQALPRLPRCRFAVVGGALLGIEGDYPERLRSLARELGIADRVVFTGHRQDVPAWMVSLDIAVNASAPEPFGMVVIEAMASGTAVIAVDAGGPRDIVRHGEDGWLIPRPDPDALTEALVTLGTDPDLRRRLGEAARQRVLERFTEDRMTERFLDICRTVTA